MIRVLKPKAPPATAYTKPLVNRTHTYGRSATLNYSDVAEIRAIHAAKGASMRQLAKRYSVSVATIHAAIHGHSWKD